MIPERERKKALLSLSNMLESIEENFVTVEEIKREFPDIRPDLMEYIEASAKAVSDLGQALIQANETIMKLDDALERMEGKTS